MWRVICFDALFRCRLLGCSVLVSGLKCLGEDSVLEELESEVTLSILRQDIAMKRWDEVVVWSSIPKSHPPFQQFPKIFPRDKNRSSPLMLHENDGPCSKTCLSTGSDWIGSCLFFLWKRCSSVSKPCTPGEHQNSWDLWMFIPLKMVLIGIDPYPCVKHSPFFCGTRVKHVQQPAPLVMIATPSSNVGNGWTPSKMMEVSWNLHYWWHTVDGCEILHHQTDGWNPISNGING